MSALTKPVGAIAVVVNRDPVAPSGATASNPAVAPALPVPANVSATVVDRPPTAPSAPKATQQ